MATRKPQVEIEDDDDGLEERVQKTLQIGLGEAIQRLLRVDRLLHNRLASVPEAARNERKMILDALNTAKLDLGLDCAADEMSDGVPDGVEVFARSAETACCRIIAPSADTSRRRTKVSSRRKKEE